MIYRIENLLVEWAKCTRLEPADVAGLGYPNGFGSYLVTNPSKARRKRPSGERDKRYLSTLAASIGSGRTAYGSASKPSKASRRNMSPEVEKLDVVIQGLSGRDRELVSVLYERPDLITQNEQAGYLSICAATLKSRRAKLHEYLDRKLFRGSYVLKDLADSGDELDALLEDLG